MLFCIVVTLYTSITASALTVSAYVNALASACSLTHSEGLHCCPCGFTKVCYMTSSEWSMPRFRFSHLHNCVCSALPSSILQPRACLSLQAIAVADFIAFARCCHASDTQHYCGCHHCLWLCQYTCLSLQLKTDGMLIFCVTAM